MKFYNIILKLLSFLLIQNLVAGLADETVYLTWNQSPTTTMLLQWVTSDLEPLETIYYKKKEATAWETKIAAKKNFPQSLSYQLHFCELLSLDPGAEYLFKISTQGENLAFKTLPSDLKRPLRFVVGGDMYHDEPIYLSETNMCAAKMSPDFALLGGDIAYAGSSQKLGYQDIDRWLTWIKHWHAEMRTPAGLMIPALAAIGNHDINGGFDQTKDQARIFNALFPFSKDQVYTFVDFSNYLTIFILDSGHANKIENEQSDWLKNNIYHKKQFYHVPAYPSIRSFNQTISQKIRKHWVPSFELGNLQAVFENHDHVYKRTMPLLNGMPHAKGITYIGDGAWGVKNPRTPRQRAIKPKYLAKISSKRHFILVEIGQNFQNFTAICSDGSIIDFFRKAL